MKFPKSIKINGFDYEVNIFKTNGHPPENSRGYHDPVSQVIGVASETSDDRKAHVQAMSETLLHEILHACWWNGQLQDEVKEEDAISVLSFQLNSVLRNNPKFRELFA